MSRKKIAGIIIFGIFLFCLFRISQYYFIAKIPSNGIFYLNNLIGFKPYYNYGLALGVQFSNIALVIINFLIIIFLINYLSHLINKKINQNIIALIFIMSGAFSNFIERLKYGFVFDYFQLGILPIFNLADVFITGGAILWLLTLLKSKT